MQKRGQMDKEFLYVGYYIDVEGRYILKIGTTNDLKRRQAEHNRNYRRSKQYIMPKNETFHYLWTLKLSKYNTIRYEDRNREAWKNLNVGKFVRNDRFILNVVPNSIPVKIRRTYQVALKREQLFCEICLLTFAARCGIMAGRARMTRPKFCQDGRFNKFSYELLYKMTNSIFPKTLDFLNPMCYTIIVIKGASAPTERN